MGYYTYYSLKVIDAESDEEKAIIADLRENNEYALYCMDEDGTSKEQTKWYEHDDEMLEFSEKYPKHILLLEGEGEESGDFWQTYYRDGKKQDCKGKVVYEPFRQDKLK